MHKIETTPNGRIAPLEGSDPLSGTCGAVFAKILAGMVGFGLTMCEKLDIHPYAIRGFNSRIQPNRAAQSVRLTSLIVFQRLLFYVNFV